MDEFQQVLVHPSVAARADGEHGSANPAPGPGQPSEVRLITGFPDGVLVMLPQPSACKIRWPFFERVLLRRGAWLPGPQPRPASPARCAPCSRQREKVMAGRSCGNYAAAVTGSTPRTRRPPPVSLARRAPRSHHHANAHVSASISRLAVGRAQVSMMPEEAGRDEEHTQSWRPLKFLLLLFERDPFLAFLLHGTLHSFVQVSMMQEEAGKDKEHTLELAPMHDVYALGDCCARMDLALPALAQVQYIPFLVRYCARTASISGLPMDLGVGGCQRRRCARMELVLPALAQVQQMT